MEKSNIRQHVTFVGALHIGFGILGLMGSLVIFLLFSFIVGFVEEEPIAVTILETIGRGVPIILGFFSTLGIIGGIGLLSYGSWAKMLILIVSAINCLNVPIGTAKGIYFIWVLMQKETIELFNSKQH